MFVDFADIPHDPNLTCHVITKSILSLDKPPPPHLYLQLDNTSRENKNWCVLTYLAVLIFVGVFETVGVSFLPVGHTHEDIDAVFSRIAQKLRNSVVKTVSELWKSLAAASKKGGAPESDCGGRGCQRARMGAACEAPNEGHHHSPLFQIFLLAVPFSSAVLPHARCQLEALTALLRLARLLL